MLTLALLLVAADPLAEASARLRTTLLAEVTQAVNDKGAAGAIDVCGDVAARVTKEAAGKGIELGRTSSKLRNPNNAAPAWVKPVLAEPEAAPANERRPRTFERPTTRRVEPIVVAPACLQCHGKGLAPDVQAALAKRYPADQATGYGEGDLRGVVWATRVQRTFSVLGAGQSEGFAQAMQAAAPSLRACGDEAPLPRALDVDLSIVIEAAGKVRSVEVSAQTPPALARCLERAVRAVTFPPPSSGLVIVKWPLSYEPQTLALPPR